METPKHMGEGKTTAKGFMCTSQNGPFLIEKLSAWSSRRNITDPALEGPTERAEAYTPKKHFEKKQPKNIPVSIEFQDDRDFVFSPDLGWRALLTVSLWEGTGAWEP
jgi:hypothetical protein